jgi:hypothetical protein
MRLVACLAVLWLFACTSERSSPECKEVCRREAQCVDQMTEQRADQSGEDGDEDEQNKFDQSECIAACTALDKDNQGKQSVASHVACARQAKTCKALLDCK